MLSDKKMYIQARDEAETAFIRCLKKRGFTDIKQSTAAEDFNHIDVFGTINGIVCLFDVKDLSLNYLDSRRYNISTFMMDDIKAHPEKYKHHYLACREYKAKQPTGKFLVFPTLNIVPNTKKFRRKSDSKAFWLFDVDICMQKSPYRILV